MRAGVQRTADLAWLVEVMRGGQFDGPQNVRVPGGTLLVSTQHRDTVVSGGVGLALTPRNRTVYVRGVALAGLAFRHTVRSGTADQFNVRTPYNDVLSDGVPAVGGGLDVSARLSRSVALVPSFRLQFLIDDDSPNGQTQRRGIGSTLLSGGLGISVGF